MGVKRIVDTTFWTDEKVMDLFSVEDRYFMLYLMTNPHTTQLGVYKLPIKYIVLELGYSQDVIKVLLERFEKKYSITKYSYDTNEIAIKNYLKYSIVKGGKPVEDCLMKEIKQVKDKTLLHYVWLGIHKDEALNETVKKIVPLLNQNDNANDNGNENDNDNDDTSTYRQRIVNPSIVSQEYGSIKEEILNNKGAGEKICEWCGCTTSVLHKHHYPIPKRLGGTEVVNICSNCHAEFHAKEGERFGGNNSDLIPINQSPINENKLLEEEFDKLWSLYPKKQGKPKAKEKYIKYRKSKKDYCTYEEVLRGLENYLKHIKQNHIDMQYIKQGSTWFNNKCWLDEYQINDEFSNDYGGRRILT